MASNFLQDLEKSAQGAIRTGVDAVQNLGKDAAAAVDAATKNTAALAGSGVSAAGKITGPIADMFGSDPHSFLLNVASKLKKRSRELCLRVADRTGKLSYVFSTAQGQRKVTAKPPSNADANQIALTLALAALDAPATMIEESGRMANGLPVKERGLAGFTVFPHALSGGGQERGLFGIDDAILLTIIVPIIAQIAAVVLPTLISAASNVIKQVTTPAGPSPEQQAAAAAAAADEEKKKSMVTIAVVAAVVLLGGAGIFVAMRKKRAA